MNTKHPRRRQEAVGDIFGEYAVGGAWDEMFAAPDVPRAAYVPLHEQLRSLTQADLDDRCGARDRSFRDRGITFSLSGEERPFPLDLVPRIIAADEWQVIEDGVAQRVQALEAFLADVYGMGRIFEAGILPRSLVTTAEVLVAAEAGIATSPA